MGFERRCIHAHPGGNGTGNNRKPLPELLVEAEDVPLMMNLGADKEQARQPCGFILLSEGPVPGA
jgi:hypothetical protein